MCHIQEMKRLTLDRTVWRAVTNQKLMTIYQSKAITNNQKTDD